MAIVSIILPVYNVEKYIEKSIRSVLAQTFQDFELLVIDDGSPDGSIQKVKQFEDSRISIYAKENGGLSDARNFGLKKAQGKYVYFMDSDDWIESDLLLETVSFLEEKKLPFVVFGYFQDNEDAHQNVTSSTAFVPDDILFEKKNQNLQLTDNLLGLLGYAWNKVYLRSFLDEHLLTFEKGTSLVEDVLFNAQVYAKSDSIAFINKAFYHYLNRPVVTLIKQFHQNSFELYVRKTESLETFLDAWNVNSEAKKKVLAYSLIHGIRYCIHNLFSFRNALSFAEKTAYVKTMVTHFQTVRLIPFYTAHSKMDHFYKKIIQKKQYKRIAFLAFLRK